VRPTRRKHPRRQPASATPGALAAEAALVKQAVEELRVKRDPRAVLETLRRYEARYPRGALAREARLTRIEALLALGRRAEVLRLLDAESGTLPRHAELRILHGELLAEAGRCAEAIRHFTAELGAGSARKLAERALYGRGSCRARLGDLAGARADLTRYLELYPRGRVAGAARRALAR
jgi:tetratricopeptide (TPR) repeat protein